MFIELCWGYNFAWPTYHNNNNNNNNIKFAHSCTVYVGLAQARPNNIKYYKCTATVRCVSKREQISRYLTAGRVEIFFVVMALHVLLPKDSATSWLGLHLFWPIYMVQLEVITLSKLIVLRFQHHLHQPFNLHAGDEANMEWSTKTACTPPGIITLIL